MSSRREEGRLSLRNLGHVLLFWGAAVLVAILFFGVLPRTWLGVVLLVLVGPLAWFSSVWSVVPLEADSIAVWDADRRRISVFTGAGRYEAWGVRRFYVRDPSGKLINILEHL